MEKIQEANLGQQMEGHSEEKLKLFKAIGV